MINQEQRKKLKWREKKRKLDSLLEGKRGQLPPILLQEVSLLPSQSS